MIALRSRAASVGLMGVGVVTVLVGVLTVEHVAVVVAGLGSLISAGVVGASAEGTTSPTTA